MDQMVKQKYEQLIANQIRGVDTTTIMADIVAYKQADAIKQFGGITQQFRQFEQMRSQQDTNVD